VVLLSMPEICVDISAAVGWKLLELSEVESRVVS